MQLGVTFSIANRSSPKDFLLFFPNRALTSPLASAVFCQSRCTTKDSRLAGLEPPFKEPLSIFISHYFFKANAAWFRNNFCLLNSPYTEFASFEERVNKRSCQRKYHFELCTAPVGRMTTLQRTWR